jgi:hypothetical protein
LISPILSESEKKFLLGVDIRTHSPVIEVLPDAVVLADGTKIPYGLLVWRCIFNTSIIKTHFTGQFQLFPFL